jgi:single-stranded-DNA-specific exonuclease
LNQERQQVEETIVSKVVETIQACVEYKDRHSLVFSGEGWHRGVIGIVAQRIAERYCRPALVIGVEDGDGVGSGRSIPGFHLLKALSSCADVFQRYGGHAQAAGFTISASRIPELESRFEDWARSHLTAEQLEPMLRVDAELNLNELDGSFYDHLRRLAPHGMGNPTPVFLARGLRLISPARLLKEKHLKFRVAQGSRGYEALAWNWASRASEWKQGQEVDATFALDESTFEDLRSLQLELKDMRAI